jgi:hypothetical protein
VHRAAQEEALEMLASRILGSVLEDSAREAVTLAILETTQSRIAHRLSE